LAATSAEKTAATSAESLAEQKVDWSAATSDSCWVAWSAVT
jgi:hypothetical protein